MGKAEITLVYVILEDVTFDMVYNTLSESGNFLTKSDSERKKKIKDFLKNFS